MTAHTESTYLGGVEHEEFRAALARLGLRQTDFAHLLAHLGDSKANVVTVNRWAKGTRAVPSTIVAILRLWEMLSQRQREGILKGIRPKR